jgi:hypothetical protein
MQAHQGVLTSVSKKAVALGCLSLGNSKTHSSDVLVYRDFEQRVVSFVCFCHVFVLGEAFKGHCCEA